MESDTGEDPKKKSSQKNASKKGDVINFMDPNSEGDAAAWTHANNKSNQGAGKNEVWVYGHGSDSTLNGMTADQLHSYLLKNSPTYANSFHNGVTIDVHLEACLVGGGMSARLSNLNPHSIVYGPSSIRVVQSFLSFTRTYLKNDGMYNVWFLGKKINSIK